MHKKKRTQNTMTKVLKLTTNGYGCTNVTLMHGACTLTHISTHENVSICSSLVVHSHSHSELNSNLVVIRMLRLTPNSIHSYHNSCSCLL